MDSTQPTLGSGLTTDYWFFSPNNFIFSVDDGCSDKAKMVWKIIEKYLEDDRILIFLYSILNEKIEQLE